MNQVKKLTPSKYNLWDNFVESHKAGSIYHTSRWLNLISKVYGHEAHYITLEREDGKIIAGLPLFIIKSKITHSRISTVPCAHACNPLVSNQSEYLILMNYVQDLMREETIQYYELKTVIDNDYKIQYTGSAIEKYSTYILGIDRTLETIKNSFHKSCIQRGINKSLRSNISLCIAHSVNEVEYFYKLYFLMRKNRGLLPQPYIFFKTMWEIMIDDNHIDILYAKHNNTVISAILLLKYKDTVIYEYGASLPDMMKLRPSQFLLWSGVQRSKEQGYKKYDFGRAANDNKKLIEYKLRWGTNQIYLPYYYIPKIETVGRLGSLWPFCVFPSFCAEGFVFQATPINIS